MWFSFGTLFCVPTPSGWARPRRVRPCRSPWRGGDAALAPWRGNAAALSGCLTQGKGRFRSCHWKDPSEIRIYSHPTLLSAAGPPRNLPQAGQRATESANWIVPNLHISQTLHHFLAAFSRLIQQMFSILLQDSNMRWAQNLAVIYLQLKFMTYTDIYIHLK